VRILPCVVVVAAATSVFVTTPVESGARRQTAERPTLITTADTKLLIVAPHPDDETLSAGGLMQRVREAGGQVHVVYVTDGDGYPEGVRFEDHIESPRPSDYRGYGRQREREARDALARLGVDRHGITFLGFPDGALSKLIRRYWSERRRAFRSPYTRLDRPPKSDIIVADTEYRGEDLTQELARTIGEYQPTLILVPRKEDQHADHCASWFFLMDALGDVRRVQSGYAPDVVNYIVHWYSWPFDDETADLAPPPGLRGGVSGWMRVPLTRLQQRTKRAALKNYRTQMHVMSWFLDGFARANEVFSRPAAVRVELPLRRNPCGE
jgi:LmbE family N-acetylglucosaminyl deacetylase